MKVVLDTNVFVSSFFGGIPKHIIDLWKSGRIDWCLSSEILDEYMEVLQRMGLGREHEFREILGLFSRGIHMIFTHDPPALDIIEKDPHDNKFFACAVALGAEAIVSGDKAVIEVNQYMGIQVYTPREFMALFG